MALRSLIGPALATATGCLAFLGCATFDIWPLAWVAFVPLLFATQSASPRRAFLLGWLAGTVANAGGFYWLTTLLMRFGGMGWAPAGVLFLLMVAYQGLHWGVFAYLLRRIRHSKPELPYALLAPVVMVALELLMPFIFDWYYAITQAWVIPVIQIADLTGPLGVTFLLMLSNGALFDFLATWIGHGGERPRVWPWRSAVASSAIIALALAYGLLRISSIDARRSQAKQVKVGVVQANIGIVQKGRARLAVPHHQLHLRASESLQRRGAELIVWPESSYPFVMNRDRQQDWPAGDPRRIMEGRIKVPLLFGALSYRPGDRYPYNTAYMMQPDGRITGSFDKNFLLVFGEYIPFYDKLPQFKKWFPAASHFNRGTEVATFDFDGYRLGPMICYEDILPAFGRRLAELRPHALVNITNDAWFGQTSEPYEHLALAVYRSVELRLDMVRAVNTGVSAFIDAVGRVTNKTRSVDPVVTPGVEPDELLGKIALLDGADTVYAKVGDLFGYLNLLATAYLVWAHLLARRRKTRRS